MPIIFGLGVSLDHTYGSKLLINELATLGFCVSYDEVVRFKQSVVASSDNDNENVPVAGSFTQWVADNADHNVMSLNGSGSFHGMGIISTSVSPSDQDIGQYSQVKRLKNRLPVTDLVTNKGIQIIPYTNSPKLGLSSISFRALRELREPNILPPILTLDLVWHLTWIMKEKEDARPNWSGYMQHVSRGEHGTKAIVNMMPLIDLSPSDETCVYSTLLFVIKQARKFNVVTPIITFDQPLWLKAVDISSAESLNIVCRMGSFHTMINFLGSIGRLMSGSGLEDMFRLNYGQDTVEHIMSGKAVSRAIRVHLLVDGALMINLLHMTLAEKQNESSTDCAV